VGEKGKINGACDGWAKLIFGPKGFWASNLNQGFKFKNQRF
jgi:hypothetical protein